MTKRNGQAWPPKYPLPAARLSQEQIDDVAAFQADMEEVERRFLEGEPGPEPKGILSDEQLVALERFDWPPSGSYLHRLALLRSEFSVLGGALVRALGISAILAWVKRRSWHR